MSRRLPPGCLLVGAAVVEITPPLTIPYLAHVHEGRHRCFEGVHDPLFAKAIVVDDRENRIALVVADSIGFANGIMGETREYTREVRQRVAERCGIPPECVMLCATHAHATPETIGFRRLLDHPGAAAWMETLATQLADAVVKAGAILSPMRLMLRQGCVDGLAASRRLVGHDGKVRMSWSRPPASEIADWGTADPETTVLCFRTLTGTPEIILVHFTCHPVAVQAQPLVSADFPGVARAQIEAAGIGCRHCLYLQGAAGDVNPVHCTDGFRDVEFTGKALAKAVIDLITNTDTPVMRPIVGAAGDTVLLPSREWPSLASLTHESRQWEERAKNATTEAEREAARSKVMGLTELIELVKKSKASYSAEVQVIRLGDIALVGIPGEPLAEFGLELKRSSLAPTILCLGYTNDYLGYIAPPKAWAQGGYEVSLGEWSRVGPEAYGLLLASARKLIGKLFNK